MAFSVNNHPPTIPEFFNEEFKLGTPPTHELPSYLKKYLERFGDGSFVICEDCHRDQLGTGTPPIDGDGVQEGDITH